MELRKAGPEDAEALAALHVACRAETYGALPPATEIARYGLALRRAQWQRWLGAGFVPAAGGVCDDASAARGGVGGGLVRAALRALPAARVAGAGAGLAGRAACGGFTATVVARNLRVGLFYAAAGGVELARRGEDVDGRCVTEVVPGFGGAR